MSNLEKKLNTLIAEQDHISPNEVNLEYIHGQRLRTYPTAKYDFSTYYGGYNVHDLKTITPEEAAIAADLAYGFLSNFTEKKPR